MIFIKSPIVCLKVLLYTFYLTYLTTVTMMTYQIQAPGDCPSSRVGHAALVIGNAFIGKHIFWIKQLSNIF